MDYNKGSQITVGRLKEYLACIPNEVRVSVGIGSESAPLHYLINRISSQKTEMIWQRRKS